MIRRQSNNPFTSPVLIGALTVLVLIVACVLAFEANNSLPFVPKYALHIEVRNAEELVHGSEIHMGGELIGTVSTIKAGRLKNGKPIAVINAEMNKNVGPLPVDTKFVIRLKSTIGEKYLDVQLGNSSRTWKNGATVPIKDTSALTDLDQVLDLFTPKTQVGVQESTNGFGQALAGRGPGLNAAIGKLAPVVRELTPVMRNLASNKTDLKGFLQGLNALTAAIAPVAGANAQLFKSLDTTFTALASVSSPYLKEWIDQTPPTLQTVINDAPTIDPFLDKTAKVFADLEPGLATLPQSAPVLASAVTAGTKTLPKTAKFDKQIVSLSTHLQGFSQDTTVHAGLQRLKLASTSLLQPLRFLTPAQTVCNYPALLVRNLASALSDSVGSGTVLRVIIVAIDNTVASGKPVPNGEAGASSGPFTVTTTGGTSNHGPLHSDPYPNTAASGETYECSAGNEDYSPLSALIGNPTGNVGTHTQSTSVSGG